MARHSKGDAAVERQLAELDHLPADRVARSEPLAAALAHGHYRVAANGTPREAELLLRSKARAGDERPAIIGECFSALMSVEPEGSLDFVAQWLAKPDGALRELAALALGESRVPAALLATQR